jgi:hypothetical protein
VPRSTAVLIAGVVAVLVAGCGGIPSSGTVQQLRDPVDVRDRLPVQSEAVPPEDGATPEEIVKGFLEALGSYEPGPEGSSYPTAADFLTPDAREEWQPHPERQAITVYGARPAVVGDGSSVLLTLSVVASYDRTASFRRAPSMEEHELNLTQDDDGEWRIANPPRGIMISEADFANQFDPYNLYFLDPTGDQVVPDPIFLPRATNESVATRLVQELLSGPSDWLDLAVETAFPDGTELSPASVPAAGEAVIGLSSQAATGDGGSVTGPDQRDQMVKQLAWTLGQLPAVTGFSVTTGAAPLTSDIESVIRGEEPDPSAARRALYGVTDAGVVAIDGDTPAPARGPLGALPGVIEVAVDPQSDRAVVTDTDGLLVWSELADGAEQVVLHEDAVLSSLAWDRRGLIWALDHGPVPDADGAEGVREDDEDGENDGNDVAGIIVVSPDNGAVAEVAVSGPTEGPVERFALSPDGTRIAAVIGGELHLGVIVRSETTLEAVDVQGLRPAKVVNDRVVDVAWNGLEELIVLSQKPGDGDAGAAEADAASDSEDGEDADQAPSDVHVVELGALSAGAPREVRHAESITAKFDGLRAVDTPPAGIQVMTETQSWTDVPDVRSPAYPG